MREGGPAHSRILVRGWSADSKKYEYATRIGLELELKRGTMEIQEGRWIRLPMHRRSRFCKRNKDPSELVVS